MGSQFGEDHVSADSIQEDDKIQTSIVFDGRKITFNKPFESRGEFLELSSWIKSTCGAEIGIRGEVVGSKEAELFDVSYSGAVLKALNKTFATVIIILPRDDRLS